MKILVLAHPRKVARNILTRILLQEHSGGIKDLLSDMSNRNCFSGRLDIENSKFGVFQVDMLLS